MAGFVNTLFLDIVRWY